MLSGSGHNTNPQDVAWFCHLCRWSGTIPAGQQHHCLKADIPIDMSCRAPWAHLSQRRR